MRRYPPERIHHQIQRFLEAICKLGIRQNSRILFPAQRNETTPQPRYLLNGLRTGLRVPQKRSHRVPQRKRNGSGKLPVDDRRDSPRLGQVKHIGEVQILVREADLGRVQIRSMVR